MISKTSNDSLAKSRQQLANLAIAELHQTQYQAVNKTTDTPGLLVK